MSLYFIDEDIRAQGTTLGIIQGHIVGGFARTQTQAVYPHSSGRQPLFSVTHYLLSVPDGLARCGDITNK